MYNAIYHIGYVLIYIGVLLYAIGFCGSGYPDLAPLCKIGLGLEWTALALYGSLIIYDICKALKERKRK